MAGKVAGTPRKRAVVALLLAGAVIGALFVGNASAHFNTNTKHLGKHAWQQFIKQRVYTKMQANKRFVNGRADLFAAVEASGGTINASVGPVTSVDVLGTGEYRVNFSQPFRPSGTAAVFAQCTAVSTAGSTCAWSFNGTAVDSLDISTRASAGGAADAVFSLVVWVPA